MPDTIAHSNLFSALFSADRRTARPRARVVAATDLAGALIFAAAFAVSSPVRAGEADAVAAEAIPLGDGQYRISATIRHADTGWDHYADRFVVLAPDGTVLGTRVLHHPHVEEQPFTRSLNAVTVPPGVDAVIVRAHDSVHGIGGATVTVPLPDRTGR